MKLRKLVLPAAVFLPFLLVAAQSAADEHAARGLKLFDEGRYADARKDLEAAIGCPPGQQPREGEPPADWTRPSRGNWGQPRRGIGDDVLGLSTRFRTVGNRGRMKRSVRTGS